MSHRQDCHLAWLRGEGYTGQINEAWSGWLFDQGFEGQINDQEFAWLGALGYTGTLNDRWFAYLRDQGAVGALPDMMFQMWCGEGGVGPGPVPAVLLDARFDSYLGVPDQALVDGQVLSRAQGVQVGGLTNLGSVSAVDSGVLRVSGAGAGWGMYGAGSSVDASVRGSWFKFRGRNTTNGGTHSAHWGLGGAMALSFSNAARKVGMRPTSGGVIQYRDATSNIEFTGSALAAGNWFEGLFIVDDVSNVFHYYKDDSGVWKLGFIGVHVATDSADIWDIACNLDTCETSQIDIGTDATAILDAGDTLGPVDPAIAALIDNLKGDIVSASFGPVADYGEPLILTPSEGAINQYEWDVESGSPVFNGDGTVTLVGNGTLQTISTIINLDATKDCEWWDDAIASPSPLSPGSFGVRIYDLQNADFIIYATGSNATQNIKRTIDAAEIDNTGQHRLELILFADATAGNSVTFNRAPFWQDLIPYTANALTMTDDETLNDDYPANGVGIIREGILTARCPTNQWVLAGGVAMIKDSSTVQNRLEGNPIAGRAGLRGDVVLQRPTAEENHQIQWCRVPDGIHTDSSLYFAFMVLRAGGEVKMMNTQEAFGFSYMDFSVFDRWVTGQDNKWSIVQGGYNSNREPDPQGEYGYLWLQNDQLLMASPFGEEAEKNKDHYLLALPNNNTPSELLVNSMQVRIDKAVLRTPQRALFNALVSQQLGPQPISEDNWVQEDVGYNEIPFGGAWTITDGVLTAHPAGGTANDKAAIKYPLEQGKAYRVIVNVSNYRAGASNVVFATVAGGPVNGPGEFIIDTNGPLKYTEGFSEYVGLGRGTLDADIDRFEVYSLSQPLAEYWPDDGVKFDGNLLVGPGYLYGNGPASTPGYALFNNHGPLYQEMDFEMLSQYGKDTFGTQIRYQDADNRWEINLWYQDATTTYLRVVERLNGEETIHVTDTSLALQINTRYKLFVADDGNRIRIGVTQRNPDYEAAGWAGASVVFDSTQGNDRPANGPWINPIDILPSLARIHWFATRGGSVKPYEAP